MSLAESEKSWVVYSKENIFGPVSALEIKAALRDSKVWNSDYVWKAGWESWKAISSIPIFTFESARQTSVPLSSPPNIPVPSPEEFKSVITPLVSAADLKTSSSNWDGRRLAWVGAGYVVAGPTGAVVATLLTSKGPKKRRQEKQEEIQTDSSFINQKNK